MFGTDKTPARVAVLVMLSSVSLAWASCDSSSADQRRQLETSVKARLSESLPEAEYALAEAALREAAADPNYYASLQEMDRVLGSFEGASTTSALTYSPMPSSLLAAGTPGLSLKELRSYIGSTKAALSTVIGTVGAESRAALMNLGLGFGSGVLGGAHGTVQWAAGGGGEVTVQAGTGTETVYDFRQFIKASFASAYCGAGGGVSLGVSAGACAGPDALAFVDFIGGFSNKADEGDFAGAAQAVAIEPGAEVALIAGLGINIDFGSWRGTTATLQGGLCPPTSSSLSSIHGVTLGISLSTDLGICSSAEAGLNVSASSSWASPVGDATAFVDPSLPGPVRHLTAGLAIAHDIAQQPAALAAPSLYKAAAATAVLYGLLYLDTGSPQPPASIADQLVAGCYQRGFSYGVGAPMLGALWIKPPPEGGSWDPCRLAGFSTIMIDTGLDDAAAAAGLTVPDLVNVLRRLNPAIRFGCTIPVVGFVEGDPNVSAPESHLLRDTRGNPLANWVTAQGQSRVLTFNLADPANPSWIMTNAVAPSLGACMRKLGRDPDVLYVDTAVCDISYWGKCLSGSCPGQDPQTHALSPDADRDGLPDTCTDLACPSPDPNCFCPRTGPVNRRWCDGLTQALAMLPAVATWKGPAPKVFANGVHTWSGHDWTASGVFLDRTAPVVDGWVLENEPTWHVSPAGPRNFLNIDRLERAFHALRPNSEVLFLMSDSLDGDSARRARLHALGLSWCGLLDNCVFSFDDGSSVHGVIDMVETDADALNRRFGYLGAPLGRSALSKGVLARAYAGGAVIANLNCAFPPPAGPGPDPCANPTTPTISFGGPMMRVAPDDPSVDGTTVRSVTLPPLTSAIVLGDPNALPRESDNLLQEGDFESGGAAWSLEVHPGCIVAGPYTDSAVSHSGASSGRVDVTSVDSCADPYYWHVQLKTHAPVRSNHSYVLRGWVRASKMRGIGFQVQKELDPYTDYGLGQQFTLAYQDHWTPFEFTFLNQSGDDSAARVSLQLGMGDGAIPLHATMGSHQVWFDDIELRELPY